MRVGVTGASGFVGRAIVERLSRESSMQVCGIVRREGVTAPSRVELLRVDDITADTDWRTAVRGVDAVVHAAARVHVMRETVDDPLSEFRRVNVAGTLNLARQAAAAGVRRFVFLSSIKVNGEGTALDRAYSADDIPSPADPYGISKLEAEQGLRAFARESDLEVVIIRPVLVYGPGVKANFRTMMSWLLRGVPLPFGAIHNSRSLVGLDNLVDLVLRALTHPAAANQTFLVSDGEDLSTTDLLRRTADALGVRARLLPVPATLIEAAARLAGKGDLANRLCGSLQVDITTTCARLDWFPPIAVDDALVKTAAHFLAHGGA